MEKKFNILFTRLLDATQVFVVLNRKVIGMKRSALFIVTGFFFLFSCQPVPLTGRRQLNLIPRSQLFSLSFQSYEDVRSEKQIVTGTQEAEMVKTVGLRVQRAVERYFKNESKEEQLNGYRWEYTLFEDTNVNAWAMPGGKVGIFTGILPVTQNDTGLAVVMGHEIAHAIADHGNERMSQQLLVQLGGLALSEALSKKPQQTRQLALAAFGLGAQIGVLLPYSRRHETEADRLGLIFMAMAGYDPHAAVDFWQRMADMKKGVSPPAFLSTHPSDKQRIRNLRKMIPEAMKYFNSGGF